MQNDNLEALKFPIGKYVAPKTITDEHLQTWIATLEDFPERLTQIVASFNDAQLDTPYRTGGWTIRQLVHHISDSHHHSYTRFKWALTEDSPLIKAYAQKDWSNLFDAKSAPITLSLNHLNAVHAKLVYLLKGLSQEDLQKTFLHPEGNVTPTLAETVGLYAWHSSHHLAHIQNLVEREGW